MHQLFHADVRAQPSHVHVVAEMGSYTRSLAAHFFHLGPCQRRLARKKSWNREGTLPAVLIESGRRYIKDHREAITTKNGVGVFIHTGVSVVERYCASER